MPATRKGGVPHFQDIWSREGGKKSPKTKENVEEKEFGPDVHGQPWCGREYEPLGLPGEKACHRTNTTQEDVGKLQTYREKQQQKKKTKLLRGRGKDGREFRGFLLGSGTQGGSSAKGRGGAVSRAPSSRGD